MEISLKNPTKVAKAVKQFTDVYIDDDGSISKTKLEGASKKLLKKLRQKTDGKNWQNSGDGIRDLVKETKDSIAILRKEISDGKPKNRIQPAISDLSQSIRTVVAAARNSVVNIFFNKYLGTPLKTDAKVTTVIDEAFGKAGLPQLEDAANDKREARFKTIVSKLKANPDYYDWLDIDGVIKSNVEESNKVAKHLLDQGYKNAFIMGMGGSGMNPKLVNEAFPKANKDGMKNIEVADNMDALTIKNKLDNLNDEYAALDETAFVFISKSGGTFEVLQNIQRVIDYLTDMYEGDQSKALGHFANRAVFIREDNDDSKLNKFIKELSETTQTPISSASDLQMGSGTDHSGILVIDHPPKVGGRYSFFSTVGMFAAALKGLNTDAFLKGAQKAIDEVYDAKSIKDCPAAKYALLDLLCAESNNFAARYVMPYTDRLATVPQATAQLAGEGNNKDKVHALPQIWGRGPTAHHSDVEALCKTTDKRMLFEEILVKNVPKSEDHVHGDINFKSMEGLRHRSMHQEMLTKLALPFGLHIRDRKDNPVVSTVLEKVDEESVGYLMMRNYLSTVIQAGFQNTGGQLDILNSDTKEFEKKSRTIDLNLDRTVKQDQVEFFKVQKAKDAEEMGLTATELAV